MTDSELIEGILLRDRKAMHHLVEKYQRQVIRTAYYFIGNMQDAEDLSQEIFIEIMNSVENFRHSSSLSTWIYRITVNKSLNCQRKNKRKKVFGLFGLFDESTKSGILAVEPSVSQHELENKEKGEIIDKSVASLPENQRIAFILHKFDDMPYKEIASVMNISLSSVESLIHRAKLNLQKKLVKHFSEYAKAN